MAERKNNYLSPCLNPVADRIGVRLRAAIVGWNPRELIYLPSERQIEGSLARFYNSVRESDQLARLISKESKGPEIAPKELVLFYGSKKSIFRERESPFRCFYLDGQYAFALFRGNPGNSDGACISFNIEFDSEYLEDHRRDYRGKGMNPSALARNDLMIVQLQGPTYSEQKSKFQVLSGIRWETILVELVLGWARAAGFPRVLLLPGEYNLYFVEGPTAEYYRKRNERLLTRYNRTAVQCGFKRPDPYSPFVLDFRR